MRMFDFAPLTRSTVGFDRVFELINGARLLEGQEDRYPAYDIIRTGEDRYRVSLAIAGFPPENITINAQPNLLSVTGRRSNGSSHQFLHEGINLADFVREFSLADHVEVDSASYRDGLLSIDLVRRIPQAPKPRRIKVTRK